MRIRVRDPSGQKVITLGELATVEDLKREIRSATSIDPFDIRLGYPPKLLQLDQYRKDVKVTELDVKLHGEQVTISRQDRGSSSFVQSDKTATTTKSRETNDDQTPATSKGLQPPSTSSGFSFGSLGEAPPVTKKATNKAPESSTPPLALKRKDHSKIMADPPEIHLPKHGGSLVLRIMPDDNSCLFRAVAFCLLPAMDTMNELRSVVAQAIQANPDKYTKVVLDNKDPDDYCKSSL